MMQMGHCKHGFCDSNAHPAREHCNGLGDTCYEHKRDSSDPGDIASHKGLGAEGEQHEFVIITFCERSELETI